MNNKEKQLIRTIENMQYHLKTMPIGRANAIGRELDEIKDYIKGEKK